MDEPMLFHDQLLATKFFVLPSSHRLIVRLQLTALLKQSLRRKLALISAPAGFGKTTLLSSWVQSFPQENPFHCPSYTRADSATNEGPASNKWKTFERLTTQDTERFVTDAEHREHQQTRYGR